MRPWRRRHSFWHLGNFRFEIRGMADGLTMAMMAMMADVLNSQGLMKERLEPRPTTKITKQLRCNPDVAPRLNSFDVSSPINIFARGGADFVSLIKIS